MKEVIDAQLATKQDLLILERNLKRDIEELERPSTLTNPSASAAFANASQQASSASSKQLNLSIDIIATTVLHAFNIWMV